MASAHVTVRATDSGATGYVALSASGDRFNVNFSLVNVLPDLSVAVVGSIVGGAGVVGRIYWPGGGPQPVWPVYCRYVRMRRMGAPCSCIHGGAAPGTRGSEL